MCEFCEKQKIMLKTECVNLSMIQWCGETKAKDLHILEDEIGVIIDTRGYLRLVYLHDYECLDHGEKIEINFWPICGENLK